MSSSEVAAQAFTGAELFDDIEALVAPRELSIPEQKAAIINAETSPSQTRRELSDPKSTKLVTAFEEALPTSSNKKKEEDVPLPAPKTEDVVDHEPAAAAAAPKPKQFTSPMRSLLRTTPAKVIDVSEDPPPAAAESLRRSAKTAPPTVSDGAVSSFKADRAGEKKHKKKKGSDSEDSSVESKDDDDVPDPVEEHDEKDYEPGKSVTYKEKHSDVDDDDDDDEVHTVREESPTLRASLPRAQKAWANYLIAENHAAEAAGVINPFLKMAISKSGMANSERGSGGANGKGEAAIASQIEKDNEILRKYESEGKGFFSAIQPLLVQYLFTLSSDVHSDWEENYQLGKAYDHWLGHDKDKKKDESETEASLAESKALVKNYLRFFGGLSIYERDMIGPEVFCMYLEGRRLLTYIRDTLGFGKTNELRKLCDMLLRGRCIFYQPQRFEQGRVVEQCVLSGSLLKKPEDAVMLYLSPRIKSQPLLFAGYLERSLALALQTANFACNPINNVYRSFREYLRNTCKFTIVKKGTKEERHSAVITNQRFVFLSPPLVTQEQAHQLVQSFCDTAPYLFGQYWDCKCVIESMRVKGGVLHDIKVATKDYLGGHEEYGPKTMEELENRKKKEEKNKQTSEKKRQKREIAKEEKKKSEDQSIPDNLFADD